MSDRVGSSPSAAIARIRSLATPLATAADLDRLVAAIGPARFACLGEASHGTEEFYRWRAQLTRRLVEEHAFTWIGVEGDWPDCWRINRWVRGLDDQDLDAHALLAGFGRWPTWMWANVAVAEFLDWLREWNSVRSEAQRVGFYGLDVYSLWDSLREIIRWLEVNAPDAIPTALEAWACFGPFGEDPHEYAWSTRLVPESCQDEVTDLLVAVRSQTRRRSPDDEGAFDAAQNAIVAADAERYYRIMVRGDAASWNIRDHHMADTIDRLATHLGPKSKGVVWEHNTHVGDARATSMAASGLVNVGQLVRERHAREGVVLVGCAGHRGTVLAASAWGAAETVFALPPAAAGSHEDLLHRALGGSSLLVFGPDRSGAWLADWRGHRAIGVVYPPGRESGNYVPTLMGSRYDALLWFEETRALQPLHPERVASEPELETEPTGF